MFSRHLGMIEFNLQELLKICWEKKIINIQCLLTISDTELFLDDVCQSPFKIKYIMLGGNCCYVPIGQFSEAGLHGSVVLEIHCFSPVLISFPFLLHFLLYEMKVVCIIYRTFFLWTFTAFISSECIINLTVICRRSGLCRLRPVRSEESGACGFWEHQPVNIQFKGFPDKAV